MRKEDIEVVNRQPNSKRGTILRKIAGVAAVLLLLLLAAGYFPPLDPWSWLGENEAEINPAALSSARAGVRPIALADYRGFGREDYLFLTGRVLRERTIGQDQNPNAWDNIKDNFKRFTSREIPDARVRVQWAGRSFDLTTDAEGYFHLDRELDPPIPLPDSFNWHTATVTILEVPGRADLPHEAAQEVLLPPADAEFGIISDIDDTVLKTDVTSRFKWRLVANTLFKNADERQDFEYVDEFFRALHRGPDGAGTNPVFYVSNSPWNLFDLLTDFLENNGLPKGPILLRDFGRAYRDTPADYPGHKTERVAQILRTYSELPFVLIGDSGEKDTDIYLAMVDEYPDRIAAIYIRDVQDTKRAERIERLIEGRSDIPVQMFESYATAGEHAREIGLIE